MIDRHDVMFGIVPFNSSDRDPTPSHWRGFRQVLLDDHAPPPMSPPLCPRELARTRHLTRVDIFLSVCIGIGLSAACGFRVFVPLLCLSVAAHYNVANIHLAPAFAWIGSLPAIIAFAVATAAEIGAYYIPWIDNLLDTIAVPLAAVAGIIVTASLVTDIDPMWKWTLAAIAGGMATTTQLATTKARVTSSATTGGLANPVLATVENISSSVLSVTSVLLPIVGLVLAVLVLVGSSLLIFFAARMLLKLFRRKPAEQAVAANS